MACLLDWLSNDFYCLNESVENDRKLKKKLKHNTFSGVLPTDL